MKKHKGFASIYALLIFMMIVSVITILYQQIYTYQNIYNQHHLIDLYVIRCIKVAHHQKEQTYPLYEYYDGHQITIQKEDMIYYASYQNVCLKVIFDEDMIIDYAYQ